MNVMTQLFQPAKSINQVFGKILRMGSGKPDPPSPVMPSTRVSNSVKLHSPSLFP
jgi:hypothetical protein